MLEIMSIMSSYHKCKLLQMFIWGIIHPAKQNDIVSDPSKGTFKAKQKQDFSMFNHP